MDTMGKEGCLEEERRRIRNLVDILDSLMGCDLGNISARDDTNVTNDDVFRAVCSAYLRPIFR
jgi:hypothetical protein